MDNPSKTFIALALAVTFMQISRPQLFVIATWSDEKFNVW